MEEVNRKGEELDLVLKTSRHVTNAYALLRTARISEDQVRQVQAQRRAERGGFEERLYHCTVYYYRELLAMGACPCGGIILFSEGIDAETTNCTEKDSSRSVASDGGGSHCNDNFGKPAGHHIGT